MTRAAERQGLQASPEVTDIRVEHQSSGAFGSQDRVGIVIEDDFGPSLTCARILEAAAGGKDHATISAGRIKRSNISDAQSAGVDIGCAQESRCSPAHGQRARADLGEYVVSARGEYASQEAHFTRRRNRQGLGGRICFAPDITRDGD